MYRKIFLFYLVFLIPGVFFINCSDEDIYTPEVNIKGITKTDKTGTVLSADDDDWKFYEEWEYDDIYQKVKNFITSDTAQGPKIPDLNYPVDFSIRPAYPNPFSYYSVISFSIPENSEVIIVVVDKDRKIVKRILTRSLPCGEYSIQFDAKDDNGIRIKKGIYRVIYRFKSIERKKGGVYMGYGDIQFE
jgi:hypothetical protein